MAVQQNPWFGVKKCVVTTLYIIINQHDAAVRSQFYVTAGSLYMFRVLSTPIIRST